MASLKEKGEFVGCGGVAANLLSIARGQSQLRGLQSFHLDE
jgi:hypothetical protein